MVSSEEVKWQATQNTESKSRTVALFSHVNVKSIQKIRNVTEIAYQIGSEIHNHSLQASYAGCGKQDLYMMKLTICRISAELRTTLKRHFI